MNLSDRELLARMIQAEAGNQGELGMRAVAAVIDNRRRAQGYGGNTFRDVLLAPGQFSPANSITGYAGGEQGVDLNQLRASQTAYAVADAVMGGNLEDPTGGALNFLNPDISQPSWLSTMGNTVRIGDHLFGTAGSGEGSSGRPGGAGNDTLEGTMPIQNQPQGLLGDPVVSSRGQMPQQEAAQPFYQRDSFKDTAAILAQGFGRMGIMGMEEIADDIAKQRTENKARNKTMEMLSKLPNGEHLMRVAEIAGPKAAVDLYISEQTGGGVGGVQSSSALPDQSGVVLTLRDGSIQVKTAGGQTLAGQEAMDFVRKSQETAANLQRDIYSARREGTNTAEAETGGAAAAAGKSGELTIDRGFKAYDDAVKAGSALRTMDEAIAAIDSGAKSGIVYNMLPNVTEASASLSNAMNRMGLDVISSVTFGALSEKEMILAMETAVPRGLAPDELRSWLVKKRDAQAKAREALMSAARYLTQPGNTLSGWMEQQGNAPTAAPAPAPTGGATRLKFNAETGEFE